MTKTIKNVSCRLLTLLKSPFIQYQSEHSHLAEISGEHEVQESHFSQRSELWQREIQELHWESVSRPVRKEKRDIYELGVLRRHVCHVEVIRLALDIFFALLASYHTLP